jgi:hypothetical protein
VYHLLKYGLVFINHKSCFPHIINLACKAVLASITEHRDVFSDSNPVANIRAYQCSTFTHDLEGMGHFLFIFSDPVIIATVPVFQ